MPPQTVKSWGKGNKICKVRPHLDKGNTETNNNWFLRVEGLRNKWHEEIVGYFGEDWTRINLQPLYDRYRGYKGRVFPHYS